MGDTVELLVGGLLYGGWKEVGITRAMDAAAGTFRLNLTDRWVGQEEAWEINAGDLCEVRIGGEAVISGYVDVVNLQFDAGQRAIDVQGRDRSADLIDCSAVHKPDQWRGIALLQLATVLGAPFGVSARAEVSVGAAFAQVKLDHGETAMEALVRHARMRGVLVMPDGRGGLLLTRAGEHRAAVALVQGTNILSASGKLDWSERFSEYLVKGQSTYREEDSDAEREAHVSGQARDGFVTRYRPLILQADADVTPGAARDRAVWEANSRIGRSAEAGIVVQGWRQSAGGALWAPNQLVQVVAPWLRLAGDMLIRQVTFQLGPQGTTTELAVVSPQAYSPEPPKSEKTKDKVKGKGKANSWHAVIPEEVRRG
ncbi:hypothetical protein QLQ15_17660 [Lysobacter sp. LF1]|uniref:Baseplate protein n=1 Tax=Lysobacter stagni TaxID=3045172 RepID=A0ABT6XKP2_9GAMM|nr:hypothetical protein [Lysobacter sp. LF1]MDI9240733.1 hypothetical protein [Lysobacter sp. LF1]